METVTVFITYRFALNVPDNSDNDELSRIIDRTSILQSSHNNDQMIDQCIERFGILSDSLSNTGSKDQIALHKDRLKDKVLLLSNRQEAEESELVQMLKNYLNTKYQKHVRFNQNDDDELNEIMEMSGFYLPQLSIADKHGFSTCREVYDIELENDEINIYLLEENPIKDAGQNLSFGELLYLTDAIVKYEEAYHDALAEMAEEGSWKERAEGILSTLYPGHGNLIGDFILDRWQNLRDDGFNLIEFKQYITENE